MVVSLMLVMASAPDPNFVRPAAEMVPVMASTRFVPPGLLKKMIASLPPPAPKTKFELKVTVVLSVALVVFNRRPPLAILTAKLPVMLLFVRMA